MGFYNSCIDAWGINADAHSTLAVGDFVFSDH